MYINLDHTYRGDLTISLISPSGTESEMLALRKNDNSTDGIDFYFMTVHCWGENPAGDWLMHIHDNNTIRTTNTGKVLYHGIFSF